MQSSSPKQIYWNAKQIEFLQARQRFKTFLGGRGSGKSTVIGGQTYLRLREMPRAKFFLSSSTYNQILTKTLPAIESKLNEFGLVDGKHYVVGKRPPAHFTLPFQPPRKYENVLTCWNGYTIECLSLDRADLARGGSYCGGDVDEAALVSREHYTKVLLPSVRGFRHKFTSDLYGNVNLYTSIPWKPSGYWILEGEEKAQAQPDKNFWLEANAWDNVAVLGEEYIRDLEAELPYLEFLVEVMNKRIRKSESAFYHRFDPDRHTYTVKYLYDTGERGIITNGVADPHYKPDALLDITFDFSGWFNCATVWQEGMADKRKAEYCLHQFFVKQDEGKVGELVDRICQHYAGHRWKLARLWGEPRGHDRKPDTVDTIYQILVKRFAQNGWKAEVRTPVGQVRKHKERNYLMNEVLAEEAGTMPLLRFNDQTCKDVIIAMQVTSIREDFGKDKRKESDRLYPQEHAPHFTDGVDYLIEQKHGWRVKSSTNRPALSAFTR